MANRSTCNVDGCIHEVYALGICNAHYKRQRKYGDVQSHKPLQVHLRGLSIGERLHARSELSGDCVVWTGGLNEHGYGYTNWDGTRSYVHRISWFLAHGPVPDGFVLDHLCHVRNCMNPDHLEVVTQGINASRGDHQAKALALMNKDTCRSGLHPWPESAVTYSSGERVCRECKRAAGRRSDAKRRNKGSVDERNGADRR